MTGLFLLLGLGLAAVWALAVAQVAWMLTHPPRRTYGSAVARGRPGDPSELPGRAREFSAWTFTSRGLELPVWEIAGDLPLGPTVVLAHGWGDSRIGGLARVEALAAVASRLILWDLPGHGEAPGMCRLGVPEAADLVALLERIGPGPTVLYGWSLGAGISIAAAAQRAGIAAVVAESPYRLAATPARNVLAARGLPHRPVLMPALAVIDAAIGGGLVRAGAGGRRFDRAELARRLACPLLVVHGDRDEICPIADGREIAAAAPRGELATIAGAGHNDLWTDPRHAEGCAAAVRRFVDAAVETGPAGT